MPTSYSDVSTSSPDRYAEQLVEQLGADHTTDRDDDTTVLELGSATARITTAPSLISIELEAEDEAALGDVEQSITRTLDRLDEPEELAVEWHRGLR